MAFLFSSLHFKAKKRPTEVGLITRYWLLEHECHTDYKAQGNEIKEQDVL
jgi:hypothetical protein